MGSSPYPIPAASGTQSEGSAPKKTIICVFCGASPGVSPKHLEAANSLARAMAANNISLVYGGGTMGLMGEVARTLVSLSGPDAVHGIIPMPLIEHERGKDAEAYASSVPEYDVYGHTTVVKDMHSRKEMMAKEVIAGGAGSGFIALAGGYGTLEELMEVVTWNQLGIHNRAIAVLNTDGYWDGLLEWVRGSVTAGFVGEGNKNIIAEAKSADEVIQTLRDYKVAEGRFKLEWDSK